MLRLLPEINSDELALCCLCAGANASLPLLLPRIFVTSAASAGLALEVVMPLQGTAAAGWQQPAESPHPAP